MWKQEALKDGWLTRREGHGMKVCGVRAETGSDDGICICMDTRLGLRYKMTPKTIVSKDATVSGELCIGMRNILSMKSVNNCRCLARASVSEQPVRRSDGVPEREQQPHRCHVAEDYDRAECIVLHGDHRRDLLGPMIVVKGE